MRTAGQPQYLGMHGPCTSLTNSKHRQLVGTARQLMQRAAGFDRPSKNVILRQGKLCDALLSALMHAERRNEG
jgi:hypothetical protein